MMYIVQIEGYWIEWKPPIGLVDAIGRRAAWMGASIYAKARHEGRSEEVAQQMAERAVYSDVYRVRY